NNVDIEGNSAIPKEPLEQNLKANLITKGELFNSTKLDANTRNKKQSQLIPLKFSLSVAVHLQG
ncbi:hypothetical protein KZ327_00085, partial [Glaesserella parasuis]|nr:hypothetical protein [Glaesserella parasuis]